MFGRRSTSTPAESESEVEGPLGKGHATPKRKEAEAARKKRMSPPRSRKEASAMRRERVKEQRVKQRQALAGSGGDDRYLPARDQGPVKKYVRDYVDSHRTIGEFLIPVFFAVFVVGIALRNVPYITSLPWIVVIGALSVDSVRIIRGVKQGVTERFSAEETKGITFYTLMRAWQMRRLRLPKSKIRPGAEI